MNGLRHITVMCFVLLIALPGMAGAAPSRAANLSAVKVGHWLQLEGTPQKDGTVQCSEVKILTGDFRNDDWKIRGPVRGVNPSSQRITIARFEVMLTNDVEFDDPAGAMRKLADVRPGMVIEVEGTYAKERPFLAKEVDNESEKAKAKPERLTEIQIVGKAERVDFERRTITAMGTTFILNDRTKVKSVIK